MNYRSKLAILGFISNVFAANFSVVSFDGACKLNVNGSLIDMIPDSKCPYLYKATADVSINTHYKYICGGKEDIERNLNEESTHNELVGRSLTLYNMPEFGYPTKEPWNRSIGRTELFDPNYVPIIIIDGSQDFFVSGDGSTTFKKMTFILKDNVFSFDDVSVEAKNADEDKFQFKIQLPTEEGIYNRNILKFRPSSYDPAFFRQILYGDIAHAIGNPTHESVAARVYLSDGTPIGLYVLQEDVTSESFIRTAFYGNKDGSTKQYTRSPIYDCATGADFNYNDANYLGGFQSNLKEADLKIELREMTRHLLDTDVTNLDSVKDFDDNWLDLDTLFRALALEYLAGHWDSFWFLTSNFVTYHPAEETEGDQYMYTKYKYYFIDQDFDQTWSIGLKQSLGPLETLPYNEFVNKDVEYWKNTVNPDEDGKDAGTRILINKFLGCDGKDSCITKQLFEDHLKSIVQYIFNPPAINRKVDGYKERLDEEIQWDCNITRLHVNSNAQFHFTYENFVKALDTGINSSHGIKDWTKAICDTVCTQFNIQYNEIPLTPETADKINAQSIDPEKIHDLNDLQSGAIVNNFNIVYIVISIILSSIIYL